MSTNTVWHAHKVCREHREAQNGHRACLLWFTGLSGSGKSTIAGLVEEKLHAMDKRTYLLDGDNVRKGMNRDLGFSDEDRAENIRRIGEMSRLFVDAGIITLSAFISPFFSERQSVRDLLGSRDFVEVFVDAPLSTCEKRDPKGLYQRARDGLIKNFTGIDSAYEVPESPEIHILNYDIEPDAAAMKVISYLSSNHYI